MCKIGTDCIITSFVANHILEGDIIRQEEVLVGVADIQAAAGDHIVSLKSIWRNVRDSPAYWYQVTVSHSWLYL
jgi:hypothetical protein